MNTLTERLNQHIAMMAPHQRERQAGKLLVDAKDEIERLRAALREVLEFQSAPEGPSINDWGRWRRVAD